MSKDLGGVTEAVARALKKGHEFAVLFLAFDGRDRHTDRMDQTLDSLSTLAVEVDELSRAAIAAMQAAAPAGDGERERLREALIAARRLVQTHGDGPDGTDAMVRQSMRVLKMIGMALGEDGCATHGTPYILPGVCPFCDAEARAAISITQDAAPAGDGERYREALIEARGELLRQQRGGDPDREEHCRSAVEHIDRALAMQAAAPAGDGERLRAVATKARDKFLHYEQLHRLKCTSEGDEKADRNREIADELTAALRSRAAASDQGEG